VVLARAPFVELEIEADGLPLEVSKVTELAASAKSRLSVTKRLLTAVPHVQMGPAEADNAEGLWLVCGTRAKGMGGS
jgi:hypothetical protein